MLLTHTYSSSRCSLERIPKVSISEEKEKLIFGGNSNSDFRLIKGECPLNLVKRFDETYILAIFLIRANLFSYRHGFFLQEFTELLDGANIRPAFGFF